VHQVLEMLNKILEDLKVLARGIYLNIDVGSA
jgi:hypothetical protein